MFKRKRTGGLTVCLSLIGVGQMLYLTRLHYSSSGTSVCNISRSFACDLVNKSTWSEFFGIPVALLGAFFFLAFAFFFAWATVRELPRQAKIFLFFSLLWSVLYATYLTAIEAFVLRAYCIFCLLSYLIYVTLFVVVVEQWGKEVLKETISYFRGEI